MLALLVLYTEDTRVPQLGVLQRQHSDPSLWLQGPQLSRATGFGL